MGYGDYYRDKYGVGRSENRSTKAWYEEELEFMDGWDDSAHAGQSVSASKSLLRHYADESHRTLGEGDVGKLNKVAIEVARLMNTVLNSESGKSERELSLAWSKGESPHQNQPESNTITLSPDLVLGKMGESKEVTPEVVDGIGGQTLLAATLKRTMSQKAYAMALSDASVTAKNTRKVWEAAETAVAKQSIIRDWPGFAPYLKRHQNLTTSAIDQVQAYIDTHQNKISSAVAAVAWTLSNPGQPLILEAQMQEAVDKVCKDLGEATSVERYLAAGRATSYLHSLFEPDDEKNNGGGGGSKNPGENKGDNKKGGGGSKSDKNEGDGKEKRDGGGGSENGGNDKKDDGKDGKDKDGGGGKSDGGPSTEPPKDPPQVTDSSLFGGGVGSSHTEVPEEMKLKENPEKREYALAPPGTAKPSKIQWQTLEVYPNLKPVYLDYAKASEHITRDVFRSLGFRRTAPAFPLHGLREGDLDDGSLDRLVLREENPHIFERKEIAAVPSVAIGILVDLSGSMVGQRVVSAQQVCIGLYEAFTKLKGLDVIVCGHNTSGTRCLLYDAVSPENKDKTRIAAMGAGGANSDGYAMEEMIKKIQRHYPNHKQKFMFVLSDGQPAGSGILPDGTHGSYGGAAAMKHMKSVCDWGYRRFRIDTYGIGIDGMPPQIMGELMYGEGHYVCLPDVVGAARIISSFLSRVATKR